MNMDFEGFMCPVCGKYKFDEVDSFEMCPNCTWQMNFTQFNNPDLAEESNTLSINESIIEYELISNKATSERAQKLKSDFIKSRNKVKASFRVGTKKNDYHMPSCADYHGQLVDLRIGYMDRLNKLHQEING